ncbi:unknown protein [Seminavis robusta]|uniref:Uncharacterized protein n=1 Tax=Seminavis robusta TaxID=568900 RepID=A0A9N8I0A1_9STRA|nr:unknown protein [Seminavis robusta]|eukprot:Sro3599_g349520.1 n/a (401) ;mRNA; f:1954-3168
MMGRFLTVMTEKSASLRRIGSAIFEPKYGRTKLQSLSRTDSLDWILVIDKFHVDYKYKKDGASNVGASALQAFLSLRAVVHNVSCAVYEMDPREAMTREELDSQKGKDRDEEKESKQPFRWNLAERSIRKEREEELHFSLCRRADANQFLRIGFFQDQALAMRGNGNYLVASGKHWSRDSARLSHEEAEAISFYKPRVFPAPVGKDSELHQMIREGGANIEHKVKSLISQGASVTRSLALHTAVANSNRKVVLLLLRLDREGFDPNGTTPLMLATREAANLPEDDETEILDILLAAGADRSAQNLEGKTAYGLLLDWRGDYWAMEHLGRGKNMCFTVLKQQVSEEETAQKLLPPNGPSPADETGGVMEGFVHFDDWSSDGSTLPPSCAEYDSDPYDSDDW